MDYEDSLAFRRNEYKQGFTHRSSQNDTHRSSENDKPCKDDPDLDHVYAEEAMLILIKKLAETYSQVAIARILNEKGLYRENGLPWKQFAVSRYFKEHGIASVHKWKGPRFLGNSYE